MSNSRVLLGKPMPITYTFLEKYSAIIVQVQGELTLPVFLRHLESLVADPAIPEDHVTLLDARGITDFRLTPDDILAIAEYTKLHPTKIIAKKLAIVIQGQQESERARQYTLLASTFKENTIVFFNIDVAYKWLGLPSDA